jgi:hypothetical protein
MGKQKQIYLSDELYEQCKDINASDIIGKLLRDYFLNKKGKAALVIEAEKIKEQKAEILKEVDENLMRITEEVKKVETIEEENAERELSRKQKFADKVSECINNTKELFNIELTAEQAEDYLNGSYATIKDYLIFNDLWQ